jgi:hypothetical protein
MKILHIAFALLATGALYTPQAKAQEETLLKAERIKEDKLPPEVLAAYKKKFPSANLRDIVKLPTKVYKKDWEIDERQSPSGDEEFYKLYLSGDNVQLEALYDRDGNLIRASEVAKNVALPTNTMQYIVKNYKGYLVKKDKVRRLIEPNSINAEWEVTVAKGKDSKRLLFGSDGEFKKEK